MDSKDVILLIIAVAVVFIAFALVFITMRKIKKQKEQNKQADLALTEALNKSKQHVLYKKAIRNMYLTDLGLWLFAVLTLITLCFLPIFQIKSELDDNLIITECFSIYENFDIRAGASKGVNIGVYFQFFTFIVTGFLLIELIPMYIVWLWKYLWKIPFDGDRYAFDLFKKIRLSENWFIGNVRNSSSDTCFAIISQILAIINYRKNTDLANDFVLCNGVSGYIAIPIICFVIAVVLFGVNIYLRRKLVNKIKNEVIVFSKQEQKENHS